ncbi:MAG: hypothetical protein N2645_06915 [Clostridia bacterium]|nr:hypothetical protein [Clostridia bacterium]
MAKNNQKCVRMSDYTLSVVEKCKGEGFNEKFENLVVDYDKTIPEREKYIQNLEGQIKDKLKTLKDIEDRIRGLKNIEFSLENLRRDILGITNQASSIVVVSQNQSCSQDSSGANEIHKKKKKCIS